MQSAGCIRQLELGSVMTFFRASISTAFYAAIASVATMASAGCNFPDAIKRTTQVPGYFYVHFSDATGIDLRDLLLSGGEFRFWDIRKGEEDSFVCVEASTTVTCSNGVATCIHAIATRDLSEIVLVSQTHQIGFAEDGLGRWTDLRNRSVTYDGVFEETFVYDLGRYYGFGPVRTARYP